MLFCLLIEYLHVFCICRTIGLPVISSSLSIYKGQMSLEGYRCSSGRKQNQERYAACFAESWWTSYVTECCLGETKSYKDDEQVRGGGSGDKRLRIIWLRVVALNLWLCLSNNEICTLKVGAILGICLITSNLLSLKNMCSRNSTTYIVNIRIEYRATVCDLLYFSLL